MRHSIHSRRLLAAAIAVVAGTALPQQAHAGPSEPAVPSRIQVPDGNKVFLVGHAVGVQIYSCDGSSWSFAAPRANLYDDAGKLVTSHFAGPTWQARDGSTAVGRREDGVTVDTTAIPWLLLSAASTATGPDGDRLAGTTYIQRTHTTGGTTPSAADCNAVTAGTTAEVPYTADYFFWKTKGD